MYNEELTLKVKELFKKTDQIYVWKWLSSRNKILYSPCFYGTWHFNKVHTSDRNSSNRTKTEIRKKYVSHGFYVFLTRQAALRNCYSGKIYKLVARKEDFVCGIFRTEDETVLFHKLKLLKPPYRINKTLLG